MYNRDGRGGYEMSFYQILSTYYDELFPSNKNQIQFIETHTQHKRSLLDVASGSGNQAVELAKKGYQVTAVDMDQSMVKKTKQKSDAQRLDISAYQMDMRDLHQFGANTFEAVICIGNSLVHLESAEEISAVLDNIQKILTNQGVFILQIVNYNKLLKKQTNTLPTIHRPQSGITFQRTYEQKDGKINFQGELIISQNNKQKRYINQVSLYPLMSNQLLKLLKLAKFSNIQLFGDFKENPFDEESPALIAVVHK